MVLLGLVLIAGASGARDIYAPVADAQATFRVIDTEGVPVTNALIKHCFHNNRTPDKERLVEKYTGTNGYAVFQGETSGGLTYRVQKDGYYSSDGKYTEWQEKWTPPDSPNIKKGRWQPWNPTFEVVLKQIKNPIPMYVKSIRTDIPVPNTFVGFDLERGAWVAPYGGGIRSDILFKLYRDLKSWQDYRSSLTITFPSRGDGIQNIYATHKGGAELAMPYSAPLDGYTTNLFFEESNGNYQEEREDQNYTLRVRTVLDENGKVASALYGKIHGNILFDVRGSETASLLFTYYLNPVPNDRNIEFDPDKNLFGGRDRFAP